MEVGITIKSKETSSKIASYPTVKSLATHSTSYTGYYCLFIATNTMPAGKLLISMHAQMKHIL